MLMFWRVLLEERGEEGEGGEGGCWSYRFHSSLCVNYYYPRFMETLLCTITLLKSIQIFLSIAGPIQLLPTTTTKAAEKEYLDEREKAGSYPLSPAASIRFDAINLYSG